MVHRVSVSTVTPLFSLHRELHEVAAIALGWFGFYFLFTRVGDGDESNAKKIYCIGSD